MKKLMFAFACAASVASFAEPLVLNNTNGFEGYDAGTTGLGDRDDNGVLVATTYYFAYKSENSSTDGSAVKAYGGDGNLPVFSYAALCGVPDAFSAAGLTNAKYLELSTEGGTLWRGAMATVSGDDGRELGDSVDLTKGTVYVDTMVQFTPTEDGNAPSVGAEDQMAIWLNVDSNDPDAPVTNLCVLAGVYTKSLNKTATTFTVPNKTQDAENGVDIVPGQWYRLTVKTYDDFTGGECLPGFKIYIDGVLIKTDKPTLDAAYITDLLGEWGNGLNPGVTEAELRNGSVFATLTGDTVNPTFSGVGFKGSGAIDDLVITADKPAFLNEVVTSIDFTLAWTDNLSAASYTIGNGTPVTLDVSAAGDTTIQVEPGTLVTVTAQADDWYTVGSGTGDITVNTAGTTNTIVAALAATPGDAGATGLTGVSTADAKAWADAKSLSLADIAACEFAKDAYLMNTDLTAAPGLKIVAIEETEGGWKITVKGTKGEGDLTLEGINGTIKVKTAATLADLAKAASEVAASVTTDPETGLATVVVEGNNKNFMKATVE